MSAPETPRAAEPRGVTPQSANHSRPSPVERWRHAIEIRDAWQLHALSTLPADRPAAEAAITELYRLTGKNAPRFVWVDSPVAALAARPPGQPPLRLRGDDLPAGPDGWPVAALLATLVTDLRANLDARVGRPWALPSWPARAEPRRGTPEQALSKGALLGEVLNETVRDPLRDFLRDSLCTPLRMALPRENEEASSLTWYGQHDAYWIAHYDVYRKLRRTAYHRDDDHQLDQWAALARSCGWWWPYDEVCVVSERPTEVHTEPMPDRDHGERRLHHPDGPAVKFADGWSVHAWHGTRVPGWVVTDPTAERIGLEANIEVRRCAIERIGWDAYIDQAAMDLVSTAPDPGNPGFELRLYEVPHHAWGSPARVLLAVNGSVERDGRRRRYGLSVPAYMEDPVSAAAWSYGLSGPQYAQLVRRT